VLPRQVSNCWAVISPVFLDDIDHVSNNREDDEISSESLLRHVVAG
jgi:hypothetical protein